MRWRGSVLLLLLLLLSGLSACSPGHLGSSVIAFVRDGHIWTIDPNGDNALEIVAQDTPVVGFAWSPTHQILTFRALDGDFARTAAARQLKTQPVTGQVADVPSTANTVGVDGGSPIPIAFSSPEAFYSNAMWNINGTRLLFRQTGKTPPGSPDGIRWWISQNDQPGGIAIKTPPSSFSIPSFSYDAQNQRVAVNSRRGLSTTTLAGTDEQFIQREPLAGHPLPASLERVLWQPAHQNAALLYALPVQQSQQSQQTGERLEVQLVLHALNGQKTTLATCACVQFAWAPDGKHVLYSDGTTYTVLNLSDHTTFTLPGAADSVPYWSPDSRFLLLDGQHTLTLVRVAGGQQTQLLSDTATATADHSPGPATLPATSALLQPVSNNIWFTDSRQFLFLTRDRLLWQGQTLSGGKGLYTVAIDDAGKVQGKPVSVAHGNITQAGWIYQDPNTSFLY